MRTEESISQRLGIRERQAGRFYIGNLIQFYKEQAHQISEKEEPYLRSSLKVFIEYMESVQVNSWEACDEAFWNKLFTFSYLDLNYEQSMEQVRAFFDTMKALSTYLEKAESAFKIKETVERLVNEQEPGVWDAVRLLDAFQQKVENPFATGYAELQREHLLKEAGNTPVVEGVFELQTASEIHVNALHLLTKKEYKLLLTATIREWVHPGTSLIGVLKEGAEAWEILVLDRVFPQAALPFLKEAIGVRD